MANRAEFADTYAAMTEGELARVLRGRRYLVPEALAALDAEIQRRSLDAEQLRKQKPRSLEKRRRPFEVEKRLKGKRLRRPGMVALIILSIFFALSLEHFGILQFYWPIVITIAVPVFTVWGFWDLRGRFWFWLTVALVVISNVVLFGLIGWPWGTHWVPGRSIAGFCILESIPIFALIARLDKRMDWDRAGRDAPAASEPPSS